MIEEPKFLSNDKGNLIVPRVGYSANYYEGSAPMYDAGFTNEEALMNLTGGETDAWSSLLAPSDLYSSGRLNGSVHSNQLFSAFLNMSKGLASNTQNYEWLKDTITEVEM